MNETVNFKGLDKSLRRQLIIDTAIKIFHRKGYRAATLDDVANELGLTRPALYHYVSSKEALLTEIYLQALASFFDTIYEISTLDLSPPEKLKVFIQRHLENVVIENLTMFTVFFSEENQLPEEDFKKIHQAKLKFNRVVENIIAEGMEQGFFRPVNVKLWANAIIGMCNWLYRWYDPDQGRFSSDEIIEQYTALIEGGLLAEPRDQKKNEKKAAPRDKQTVLREIEQQMQRMDELVKELARFS